MIRVWLRSGLLGAFLCVLCGCSTLQTGYAVADKVYSYLPASPYTVADATFFKVVGVTVTIKSPLKDAFKGDIKEKVQ